MLEVKDFGRCGGCAGAGGGARAACGELPTPLSREGVLVGAGAKILGNITIGEGAKIGAGSVVTKDIPANCVAAGNPAKVVKALNPNRRMLTRAFLFKNGDQYWQQQNEVDAYFTLDNSTAHWLRSFIKPSHND